MKLTLVPTTQFKKDYKLLKKRGYKVAELEAVLDRLMSGVELDERNRDHALVGEYAGFRECHIRPDWLFMLAKFSKRFLFDMR